MKAKAVVILLAILSIGMGVVLLFGYKQYQEESKKADKSQVEAVDFSNQWQKASTTLRKLEEVNIDLEDKYTNSVTEVSRLKQELAGTSTRLAKSEADAKAAALAAQEEIDKRDKKIAQLTTEKDDITKRMQELNVSIKSLENQIADTEKKLQASEGDRDFLLKELKRLQSEKMELEKQFNNLAFLREQVKKLKDELSMAKRLDWVRRGLYGSTQKGGELLQKGFNQTSPPSTNFNLNVEMHQKGDVNILRSPTNAPPQTPANTNAPPNK